MSKLPSVTGKELIAVLGKIGFQVIRVKGSHHFLRHQDDRKEECPLLSPLIVGCIQDVESYFESLPFACCRNETCLYWFRDRYINFIF